MRVEVSGLVKTFLNPVKKYKSEYSDCEILSVLKQLLNEDFGKTCLSSSEQMFFFVSRFLKITKQFLIQYIATHLKKLQGIFKTRPWRKFSDEQKV